MQIALGIVSTLLLLVTIYAVKMTRDNNLALDLLGRLVIKTKKLERIVKVHGCAPDSLVAEGHTYTCDECGTTWKAQAPEVTWFGDSLKNVTSQKWDVVSGS